MVELVGFEVVAVYGFRPHFLDIMSGSSGPYCKPSLGV